MDVYIKTDSRLARMAARILKTSRIAVTVNRTIYLYNCNKQDFLKNKKWVCHEIAHIGQYKRIGSLSFVAAYLFQCLVNGYKNNKFEKEARAKENDLMVIEGINFI